MRFDGRLLAGRRHVAVALSEPDLRPPCDLAHDLRETLEPLLHRLGNAGRMAIAPRALHQNVPRSAAAGQRQAAAFDAVACRVLRRSQAKEGHRLPGVSKRLTSPTST